MQSTFRDVVDVMKNVVEQFVPCGIPVSISVYCVLFVKKLQAPYTIGILRP